MKARKVLKLTGLGLFALLVLAQFVPYGRIHTNPADSHPPSWDSPETEALARRACFDCHSNESRWPWYSWVAPASWRVQNHVEEAREHLNFSRFDLPQRDAHEAAEVVREGEMPLWDYLLLHPNARLAPEEKQKLIAGLARTFGERDRERDEEGGRKE